MFVRQEGETVYFGQALNGEVFADACNALLGCGGFGRRQRVGWNLIIACDAQHFFDQIGFALNIRAP